LRSQDELGSVVAGLGGIVGDLCCADRHLREGWRRKRQCRFRDLHPHYHHRGDAGLHFARNGAIPVAGCDFLAQLSFSFLSGLATGASWICYFRALKIGEAAKVAPIDKLSVVLVAIFGVIFLGERLTTPNWLGVALIAAGAILVAYR